MKPEDVLRVLQYGNQLKRTARTGWVQRGVPQAENVAAHSYGVAFTALVLAQLVTEPLDLGRVLALALLHDLPESVTTDIPPRVWRLMPAGMKQEAEQQAMGEIFGDLPVAPAMLALWEELVANETAEAKLVHDADKLELFLQAANYEAESGSSRLAEFWQKRPSFHFPVAETLFEAISKSIGRLP